MTVTIDLALRASQYIREVKKAVTATKTFTDEQGRLRDASGRFVAKGESMTSKLKGLGKDFAFATAGAAALVAGYVKVGGALADTAASVEDSRDKFTTLFGSTTASMDKFVADWSQLVGVTTREAQDLVSNVAAIAQGMGYTRAESAEFSKQLITVAGDLASFNDVSNERASEALASALTGEREQLKQLGIVIHEADVQTKAFAMTGKESAKSLTQQEKAAATLELVMERAGEAIGDAERTADSLTKQLNRSRASWRQLFDDISSSGSAGTVYSKSMGIAAEATRHLAEVIGLVETPVKKARREFEEITGSVEGIVRGGNVEKLESLLDGLAAQYNSVAEQLADANEKHGEGSRQSRIYSERLEVLGARLQEVDGAVRPLRKEAEALAEAERKAAEEAERLAAAQEAAAAAAKKHEEDMKTLNEALAQNVELSGYAAEKSAEHSKALSDRLAVAFDKARTGAQELSTELLEIPETVLPKIKAAVDGGGNFFDKLFGGVQGKLKKYGNAISGFLEDTFGSKLGSAITDGLGAMIAGPLGGLLSDLSSKVLSSIGGLAKKLLGIGKTYVADFTNLVAKGYTITNEMAAEYNRLLNEQGRAAADAFAKQWAANERANESARRGLLIWEQQKAANAAYTQQLRERLKMNEAIEAQNARQAAQWEQTYHTLLMNSHRYNENLAKQLQLEEKRAAAHAAFQNLIGKDRFGGRGPKEWDQMSFDEKLRESANPNSPFFGRNPRQEAADAGIAAFKRRQQHEERFGGDDGYIPTEEEYERSHGKAGMGEVVEQLAMLNAQVAGGALGEHAARDQADRVTIGAPAAGFAR